MSAQNANRDTQYRTSAPGIAWLADLWPTWVGCRRSTAVQDRLAAVMRVNQHPRPQRRLPLATLSHPP